MQVAASPRIGCNHAAACSHVSARRRSPLVPCVADCAYCLLETIEFVHGAGFVSNKLRITVDYPILPRACVPQLAAVLASAQQRAVLAALRSAAVFGLDVPAADVTDLFLPVRDALHGEVDWYRGMSQNEYLYRCGSEQAADEVWVVSGNRDEGAWSRCEGRLWVDLESARARTDGTDRSATPSGVFFDLGVGRCAEEFAAFRSGSVDSDGTRAPDAAEPGEPFQRSPQAITFAEGVSTAHIACTLLWRLGPFSTIGRAGRSLTVRLPSGMDVVQLLGHIVVGASESLRIEADAFAPATLAMGQFQFQVHAGGKLELHGVSIVDAVGASAMVIRGEVVATNCTFSRCVAGPDVILRIAESNVPEGTDENPPVHGVWFASQGGAAAVFFSAAIFTASGCLFSDNAARGARLAVNAGAIAATGGRIVLNLGTVMRANVAGPASGFVRGGAISGSYAFIDLSHVEFDGNAVYGDSADTASKAIATNGAGVDRSLFARGGAIDLSNSQLVMLSVVFTENKVRDGSISCGGALYIEYGSAEVLSCSFLRNEALNGGRISKGGAIDLADGAVLRLTDTTFEGNFAMSPAEAFGGALSVGGSLGLDGGVVFRANVASGGVRAGGGAIAVRTVSTAASMNASSLPGPIFVGNTVRHAFARRPDSLLVLPSAAQLAYC
jgi:hypothetical protein